MIKSGSHPNGYQDFDIGESPREWVAVEFPVGFGKRPRESGGRFSDC